MKNYAGRANDLHRSLRGDVDVHTFDNTNELCMARARAIESMKALVDTAEAESRDLSRTERARFEEIDAEVRDLDQRIAKAERRGSGAPFAGTAATREGRIALAPEERLADVVAEQRGSFGTAGDGLEADYRAGDFNLSRVIGALAGKVSKRDLSDVETRALAEGTGATGGFLVPEILSAKLIDRARNASSVLRAGALTIPMGSADVHLARLVGGNTAEWKLENDPITESDQSFERVTLSAKTLPVLMRLSVELHEDMSPEGHALVEREIVSAIALELDRAALRGDGTNPAEPIGVRNQTGVNLIDFAGATPADYDVLIDAIAAIRDANGSPNGAIFSSAMATTFDKLKDSTGQPLRQPEVVAALAKHVSNQVPSDLGVGSDESEIYVADWSTVLIGVRPTLTIRFRVLDERYADRLQIGLLAWLRADVAMAHPEHATVVHGVKP